jgi:hypothetical protein
MKRTSLSIAGISTVLIAAANSSFPLIPMFDWLTALFAGFHSARLLFFWMRSIPCSSPMDRSHSPKPPAFH